MHTSRPAPRVRRPGARLAIPFFPLARTAVAIGALGALAATAPAQATEATTEAASAAASTTSPSPGRAAAAADQLQHVLARPGGQRVFKPSVSRRVAVHPRATLGLATRYAGTKVDVLTYHLDNARTGWNAAETALTPATVSSGKFGLLSTLAVDGEVYAQPLLVNGITMADGSVHDLLVVATMSNSVYAFDAQSLSPLWHVNFGPPQDSGDVGCSDALPHYGIAATPVVAPNKSALFVVDAIEPTAGEFHSRLHKLSLADGHDLAAPSEIAPSATMSNGAVYTFDPKNQWARAGLVFTRGTVWVSIGSHCDNNPVYTIGWMVRYDKALSSSTPFHTIENPWAWGLAGIWQSGFAPAVDPNGNLYAITGNGDYKRKWKDYGESVIKVPPSGSKVTDWFTPAAWDTLNGNDIDFGSGAAMLIPPVANQVSPPLLYAMGKDGVMYLLNRDNLGHLSQNDANALQATRVSTAWHGVWGGPAYWNGPSGGMVFAQTDNDVLKGYAVDTGATPSLTQTLAGTSPGPMGGTIPWVSSNGSQPGTGIVWMVHRDPLTLEAYDAEKLGAPIYSAGLGTWTAGRPYLVPVAANGRVYVAGPQSVMVFGLTP